MNSSELLTAPATAPETTTTSEAGDVRTALQRLRDEASTRGAERHAASNEKWADRKRKLFDSLQIVRESVATARRGFFDLIGGAKTLRDQPELRAQLARQLEAAAENAADRAVDKGLAAVDRAEARVKELYTTTAEVVGSAKAQAMREARVGAHVVLATGSEILAKSAERKVLRREKWASKAHEIADTLDKTANMASRGREKLVSAGHKVAETFDAGGIILREAIQEALRFRNPIRFLAQHLDKPRQQVIERRILFLQRAGDHRAAIDQLRSMRGPSASGDRPQTSTLQTEPEVTWSTRENFTTPVEPPVANAVSFAPGSAGATPDSSYQGTPISPDTASRGAAAAAAADLRFNNALAR